MTTRAVAYFRMSTDAQEGSIPAQRAWAKQAAAREGLRLAAEFDDPGISGGLVDQRPGLQAMLDYADRQFVAGTPLDAVLVWDPDRLSRADSLKTAAVLSRLKDAGVGRLLTASDGWVDLDDATHRILYMLKQDLGRAGFCEGLSRNVLRGKQAKAAQGLWVGGLPPYGYRLDAGKLVPDPETGPVVTWLFAAYAAGTHSMADLLAELHRRGVVPVREARRRANGEPPRPPLWRKNVLHVLFANRTYLGHTVWNLRHAGRYNRVEKGAVVKDVTAREREHARRRRGLEKPPVVRNPEGSVVVVPHTHEPLIDAATFDAVQRLLARNRSRKNEPGRSTPVRGGGGWILTGLLRCGACGCPMHGLTARGAKGETLRYYACSRSRTQRACWSTKRVRQDVLLAEVVEELREQFSEGPALNTLRARVARLADKGSGAIEADRERLRAALATLEGKIRQAEANLALCSDPDDFRGVSGQLRRWREEREQAARDLERLAAAADAREDVTEKVEAALARLGTLHEAVRDATPAEARAALGAVIDSVTVHVRRAERTAEMGLAAVEVCMADAVVSLFTTS
jgi:site-specific DNA recombinase